MNYLERLEKAVEIAGGIPSLAKVASAAGDRKVERSHVWNWINRDKRVPADYVLQVSRAIGYAITPHQFRPDLYPNATDGLPSEVAAALAFAGGSEEVVPQSAA